LALFKKNNPQSGLTGVGLHGHGASVVRVRRSAGAPPCVTVCEFRSWIDGEDRGKALGRLAGEYGLKRSRCTTALDPGEYNLLLTEAPEVPDEELRAAIRWRIKDIVDFPIQNATIELFELPGERVPGRPRSVYAVAARSDAIQRRVDLLTASGINLDVVDIPELAQRNLAALLPQDARGVVMLSFSRASGLITITRQGEIYLSRSLDVGLEQLQAGALLSELLDRIVLELQRSLDYYDSYFRLAPVTDLVLVPLPAEIPGLLEHLNANLSVTATVMEPEQVLDFEVAVPPAQFYDCLWTLGVALRQEMSVP